MTKEIMTNLKDILKKQREKFKRPPELEEKINDILLDDLIKQQQELIQAIIEMVEGMKKSERSLRPNAIFDGEAKCEYNQAFSDLIQTLTEAIKDE